jgi:RND family efflux transporter MFP subunit
MYKDNTNPEHSMHVVGAEPEPPRVDPEPESNSELRQPLGRWFYVGWALAILAVLCTLAALLLARNSKLNRQTLALSREEQLGQRVLVQPVLHPPAARALELPATLRGFTETPIYAKIPGYLKAIKVDKGDRVTKGQVLAVLESPELDQQVANARATYNLNLVTDQRYQTLAQEGVFARQTADESHNTMLASQATLNQYLAMETYKVITAPFSGVVTARYVDPGALIPQATTSAANTPLLALATLSPLRVYADVPQPVAPFVHDGDSASVTVGEYPGRVFPGKVARHPEALAIATRTMLVEVDLPNREQLLFPGMYAKVVLHISAPTQARMVPDDALIFRDGKPYVPVVRENRLKLVPVTLGFDDGVNVQINGEVADQDLIALSVGQSARDGERVQPIQQGQ